MSMTPDSGADDKDLSSFTLNFNRMTGGFRGRIKVESPYEPGVYVTRGYSTSPIYESDGGVEFARMSVQAGSPNEAARDARIDPETVANPHPGISFNRVNQGVYFPASDEDVAAAAAEGKRLPVGKAYALMPFTDPGSGIRTPFVVELTAWPPKPKEQGADAGNSEPVTWYGGSAKIFDRAAYLAVSRKYGQADVISGEELEAAPLPDEELPGQGEPKPDEGAARQGADKRAKRRRDPAERKPDDTL
jgi:hypothetical protein